MCPGINEPRFRALQLSGAPAMCPEGRQGPHTGPCLAGLKPGVISSSAYTSSPVYPTFDLLIFSSDDGGRDWYSGS